MQTTTVSSLEAISNCISAMARHAQDGNRPDIPEQQPVALGGGPPITYTDNTYDPSTLWSAQYAPPLIEQMEKASMAPFVQFDESHANVGCGYAQALVVLAGSVVIIHIEPDRSKTISRLYWMVLNRPLLADMHRSGHAFKDVFRTCLIHIEW